MRMRIRDEKKWGNVCKSLHKCLIETMARRWCWFRYKIKRILHNINNKRTRAANFVSTFKQMASSLTNKIMNFRMFRQKFAMEEKERIFVCIMRAYNSANDDGFSADFSPFCKSKSHYGIDYGVSYAYPHSPTPSTEQQNNDCAGSIKTSKIQRVCHTVSFFQTLWTKNFHRTRCV